MLSGDNGILQRATDAKTNTERAQIIEEIKLDVAGAQIEKNGGSLYKSELKEILKKYFKDVDQANIPNEITSSTDTELTTLNEKHTIKLSELYSGKLATLAAGLYKAGTNEQISPWTDIVGTGKCVTVSDAGVLERNAFAVGDIKVKLVIDSNVKTIGNMSGISQLEEVEIPEGVTSINSNAFAGCSNLKSIEIPSSVNSINSGAFSGCSKLQSLEIPDAVTSISGGTLAGCVKLESIYIPNGIKSFVGGLFYNCSNLTDVYYDGGKDEWADISIEGGNDILSASTTTIHYLRQKYDEEYWDKLYVGATIVGYDPTIAPDGSKINTSYTSLGSYNSGSTGTYGDGTTGNGNNNTTFTVSSIKKWKVLDIDKNSKQLLITSNNVIYAVSGGNSNGHVNKMEFCSMSGYANYNDELNKICCIYGQGKYADTTKFNLTLQPSSVVNTGGRSVSYDDYKKTGFNFGLTEKTIKFIKNATDGYIYQDNTKSSKTNFQYWGECATHNQVKEWKQLESGESVELNWIYGTGSSGGTTILSELINASDEYWITGSFTSSSFNPQGFVNFCGLKVNSAISPYALYSSDRNSSYATSGSAAIRPAVYLKPNLKLSYNPTTQAFAIESE